mmetsp:Transcript_48363/g.146076  ORF Transcript_48363/g.146076 Transcript_48363/m.146076 type:complete len:514 (-) Transcript_48363:121-1662(-)
MLRPKVFLYYFSIAFPHRTGKTQAFSSTVASVLVDRAPSWADLNERILATTTGKLLRREADLRETGRGAPHADATLRLFDAHDEADVRITLFRDGAAWCPYCQKVWVMLEEKAVPYRVEKVPLNAYGDKPAWFTRKVDGGQLPAIELDGHIFTESMEIMKLIDALFVENLPRMVPGVGTMQAERSEELLQLEKDLQSAWFSLVFYPVDDTALERARSNVMNVLDLIDKALGATTGPWFLGGDAPSIVDLQYISHMERIIASVLYWKGLNLRGQFENIDKWLEAFDSRPSYRATKSDYFTLVTAIPSQNGPGYVVAEARSIADQIYGLCKSWKLPLGVTIEPLSLTVMDGDGASQGEAARHEAAFCLISRHEQVGWFACRGAGEPGRPSFHAELADPYAEPNEEFFGPVDICLRHVAVALIDGTDIASISAAKDLNGNAGNGELRPSWGEYEDDNGGTYFWNEETGDAVWTPPTSQLDTCLAYLRDRIGVPRDMSSAAAMQLRAHLNWAIDLLQ